MASANIDLYVDETYLLALINDEAIPISDEKYAEELTLQEALFSSSSLPSFHESNEPDFPTYTTLEECNIKDREVGESSQTKLIVCGICMESKATAEIFTGLCGCSHPYCVGCIIKYVTSKIKESTVSVDCPDPSCKQLIEPNNCSTILPKELFSRWENAICESLIPGSQKFYCPYQDCSALMVDDGGSSVTMAECPSCRRMFCAQCRVRWHNEITCEEFQRLREDEREVEDIMVMKLAKDKKWGRCSSCGFYVEKTEGCLHMKCRCHYEFCYQCGSVWSSTHNC